MRNHFSTAHKDLRNITLKVKLILLKMIKKVKYL